MQYEIQVPGKAFRAGVLTLALVFGSALFSSATAADTGQFSMAGGAEVIEFPMYKWGIGKNNYIVHLRHDKKLTQGPGTIITFMYDKPYPAQNNDYFVLTIEALGFQMKPHDGTMHWCFQADHGKGNIFSVDTPLFFSDHTQTDHWAGFLPASSLHATGAVLRKVTLTTNAPDGDLFIGRTQLQTEGAKTYPADFDVKEAHIDELSSCPKQ